MNRQVSDFLSLNEQEVVLTNEQLTRQVDILSKALDAIMQTQNLKLVMVPHTNGWKFVTLPIENPEQPKE